MNRAAEWTVSNPLEDLELVDLTLAVAEDLPCWWPAHLPYQQKTFNYFADQPEGPQQLLARAGPYQTRWLLIDEHTGTHFDAPTHFIPPPASGLPHAGPTGEVSAERVPLGQLMGRAAVLDAPVDLAPPEPGASPFIEPEVVSSWETAHGELRQGEVVLFRSGWDRLYRRGTDGSGYCEDVVVHRTAPGWPAPGVETMRLLLERGIRCVGTDAPTMGAAHDGVPVHLVGLAGGAVFIEGLANLAALPPRGAWFCFAPLKLERGTGAPGRAFAFVPKNGVEEA
jgi:kynurenine formamidase